MKINKIFFTLFFVGGVFFFTKDILARDAIIYVSPITAQYQVGSVVPIKLWLKVGEFPINKFEIVGSFSEDFLELEHLSVADYIQSNSSTTKFDNEGGTFTVNGKIEGGLVEDTAVATLFFKVKKEGSAGINLYPVTTVFVNDQPYPIGLSSAMYFLRADAPKKTIIDESLLNDDLGLATSASDNEIVNSSIFIGEPPLIKGIVKSSGSRIELSVDNGLVEDRVFANGLGEWLWPLPTTLLPGAYVVKISVIDTGAMKIKQVDWIDVEVIKTDVSKNLFKLIVDSTDRNIKPGDSFNFNFSLLNLGNQGIPSDQYTVEYYIEDEGQSTILEDEVKLNQEILDSHQAIIRSVLIPKDGKAGEYSIYAKLKMNNEEIDSFVYKFKVLKNFNFLIWILGGAVAILVLAWVIIKKISR